MSKFFANAGGALIGGALSGISNLFGAHSQNQSVDKQLQAAREEAEKTRKWQTSEREAQNDWNFKLWQANNEYNTPAAVQARLKAAGINPDFINAATFSKIKNLGATFCIKCTDSTTKLLRTISFSAFL